MLATLTLMGERRRHTREPERLPGKVTAEVEPGDRLVVPTPGGGGWGTPRA